MSNYKYSENIPFTNINKEKLIKEISKQVQNKLINEKFFPIKEWEKEKNELLTKFLINKINEKESLRLQVLEIILKQHEKGKRISELL